MKKNSFILFLLFTDCCAFAQSVHNNGAVISLADQTVFVAPDSLVNKGTLVNNGDLRISGAWVNLGTYDAGTGQINFNSNLTQTINHSDQSFNKLVISGSGEKTFSANITIESELDLQNSVLKSANGARLVLNSGAVVVGGSNQSHVVGSVEIKGAGNWLFPIGNGSSYLPVEVNNVTDPNAVATLTLHDLTTGQVLSGDKELTAISSKRYWELVFVPGALNQSKIKLPVVNEDALADDLSSWVVVSSDKATEAYISLGQSSAAGSLSSGSVTSELAPATVFYTLAAISSEHAIEIFNAVSTGNDNKNDFFRIANIEFYPNNRVIIFNRWGDRVFEISGYDNDQKSFRGESNINGSNKLPSGNLFYSIELGDGSAKKTGYLVIK